MLGAERALFFLRDEETGALELRASAGSGAPAENISQTVVRRVVETRQPVQIITNLPEMLTAFDTIDALAGAQRLVVAGHDPLVAERFTPVEPGIIRIA